MMMQHWGGAISQAYANGAQDGKRKQHDGKLYSAWMQTECNEPRVKLFVPKNILFPTEMHWCSQGYLHWSGRDARKNVQMIFGMWTRIEVCENLGKDLQSSLYWKRNLQRDICGPGGTDKKSSNYQTWECVALSMDQNWKSRSQERKARMGNRETKTR